MDQDVKVMRDEIQRDDDRRDGGSGRGVMEEDGDGDEDGEGDEGEGDESPEGRKVAG